MSSLSAKTLFKGFLLDIIRSPLQSKLVGYMDPKEAEHTILALPETVVWTYGLVLHKHTREAIRSRDFEQFVIGLKSAKDQLTNDGEEITADVKDALEIYNACNNKDRDDFWRSITQLMVVIDLAKHEAAGTPEK